MISRALQQFHTFFDHCIGGWETERTYHHLSRQEVERSKTEFTIRTLTPPLKAKVLADNNYPPEPKIDQINGLLGFHLDFDTVSESGEQVSQSLNMLFLPKDELASSLEGDYLRDRAYEEDRPIVAHFRFDPQRQELVMTTTYTEVIAIDTIRLLNPRLRLRQILTYRRPVQADPPKDLVLVGFGVEQKIT